MVENLLQCWRPGFDPWVGKIPWRRAWQPTSVFLPGESPWTEEPGGLQSIGSQSTAQHIFKTKAIYTQNLPLSSDFTTFYYYLDMFLGLFISR